jgi:choline dehydrogenase-like flavoprotein
MQRLVKGFFRSDDYNGDDQLGVGYCHLTIKDWKRHSPGAAFLIPVLNRTNLTVVTSAAVQKLLFNVYRQDGT